MVPTPAEAEDQKGKSRAGWHRAGRKSGHPRQCQRFQDSGIRAKSCNERAVQRVTVRKNALGEAFAKDCHVRMLRIVRQLKVVASQQTDAESIEKAGPNRYSDRHDMETSGR